MSRQPTSGEAAPISRAVQRLGGFLAKATPTGNQMKFDRKITIGMRRRFTINQARVEPDEAMSLIVTRAVPMIAIPVATPATASCLGKAGGFASSSELGIISPA